MRCAFAFLLLGLTVPAAASTPPHLTPKGTARQLIVDDKPFLILGGELGNSTASGLGALRPHWADFGRLHLNTNAASAAVPISVAATPARSGEGDRRRRRWWRGP